MNTTPSNHNPSAPAIHCQAPAEVTSTSESAFRVQLEHIIGSAPQGWSVLQIDLHSTRMIDSKGLNLLVSIVKRLRGDGRGVRLVSPQPAVRRILAFTRLDRHAEVVDASGVAC